MRVGDVLGRVLGASALISVLALPGVASPQPLPARQANQPGARPSECGGAFEAHAPIVIAGDADLTAANGVRSGSGTDADPFVISCWAITVPENGQGVRVAGQAVTASFVIRDVTFQGPGPGQPATGARAVDLSAVSNSAVVDHVSAQNFNRAIFLTGGGIGRVEVRNSLITASRRGINITDTNPLVTDNLIVDSLQFCMDANGGLISNNTCRGGTGPLQVTGAVELTGNLVELVDGDGFVVNGGNIHDNVARNNGNAGFRLAGVSGIVAERNTADSNIVGFDITIAIEATLRDNTAVHNASTGIQGFAIQNVFPSHRNILENNHIGWNPFGIVFEFMNNSNQVSGTDWLDGHPAYIRWTDPNTIVDAGSNYRGVPGEPTRFHDWIAAATVGTSPEEVEGLRRVQLAVVTDAHWDFGDGQTQDLPQDPLQGHGPPPDLMHTYEAPGEYTATLTVNGLNNQNQPITLADTTTVTIVDEPAAGLLPSPEGHEPWPALGNDPARTFFNGAETTITPGNVSSLDVKWRFPTTEPVTAAPAVATIDIGGEPTEAVFDGSYSGTMYALRASNGSPLWITCLIDGDPEPFCDPQSPDLDPDNPNASRQQAYGAIVDSPTVAKIALPGGVSEDRVFIGVGGVHTDMVALNANTGVERWRFIAADSAPTYSVSGSPVVVGDTVYFGVDCNNECDNGSGIYAISAVDGTLKWFWDVHSGRSFVAPPGTKSFDPGQMRGNDSIPLQRDCGAVWSSPAIDVELGLAYVGTADCTHVPMTDHEEAVVALNLHTGAPVWRFQPRQIDKRDMDFGATPNVFKIGDRHAVGAGGKDGTYYALDAQSGDEIWSTKLALGGNFGGFYGTATDGQRVYLTNAIAEATDFQTAHEERLKGMEFALDARTGNVEWIQHLGSPTVGMNSVSPGIYWSTGLDHNLHAWDAATGDPLGVWNVQGAASSAPTIADGHVYVGAGTGATYRAAAGDGAPDPLGTFPEHEFPHPIPVSEYGQGIYSFCLTSEPDCAASRADPESVKRAVLLTNTGDQTGPTTDEVTMSATVQEALAPPIPVPNAPVTFTLEGESCTATTGPMGEAATCSLSVEGAARGSTVKTSYAGDDLRRAADDFDPFLVSKEVTALAYTGALDLTNTESVELGARLTEDDGAAIGDATVTLTIGDQSCTATTGGAGNATCTIDELDQALGAANVVADFAGNDRYEPAQLSTPVTVASPSTDGQDDCPAEKASADLGAELPAGGSAAAGATIGFPFAGRRLGWSRRRGRLLSLVVIGAAMAVTLAGCGFFGGPSPTPGC